MNRPMLKIVPMNDITTLRTNDMVLIVDDRQYFVIPLPFFLREKRIDEPGESHPIFKAELLGPGGGQKSQSLAKRRPIDIVGEILAELLATLRKAPADQLIKKATIVNRKLRLPRLQRHHGRVNHRPGNEAARWNHFH